MTDFATLGIQINTSGAAQANSSLRGLQNQAGQTERAVASLERMVGNLKALLGLGFGVAGINSLIQMADKMKSLNNQIKFVTNSTNEYNQVQRQLFSIAQNTRASFEATATLYTRSARALKDYGYSQQQVLNFTETLNKAMAVGGVGAQEQASALLQLSQALGSGRLQGDEFRSISETAPIILDTVAEYMGKSRAEVKQLATEGKITSQVLFDAMSGASKKISEQFDTMPLTFGQAMQQMQNSVLKWVSDMDTASGITGALASVISLIAENFAVLAKAIGYATIAYAAYNAVSFASNFKAANNGIGLLASSFSALTTAIRTTTVAMLANPIGLLAVAIVGVIYVFDQFISKMEIGFGSFNATWGDVAVGVWEDFKDVAVDCWNTITDYLDTAIGEIANSFGSTIDSMGDLFGLLLEIAKSTVNGFIGLFELGYKTIVLTWNNFPAAMESLGKAALNGLVSIVEEGINYVLDAVKGLLGFINNLAAKFGKENLFDLSGFKVTLPKVKGSDEAEKFKKELKDIYHSVDGKDYIGSVIDSTKNYIMLAGAKGNILSRQHEEQADLNKKGVNNMPNILDDGKTKKAKKQRKNHGRTAEEEMQEWIANQKQKIQGQTDELRMIGLLESEKNKLNEVNQLEMDYQKQLISTSPELRSELTAQYELIKQQLEEMQQLREYLQSDPVAGIKDGFAKFGDSATDVMGNVSQITQDAFNGMTSALTDLVLTGKADFKSLATSIINDIVQMTIKMLIFKSVSSMFGGFSVGGSTGSVDSHAFGGLAGFDEGGFTGYGGKYQPAGIVHKGEYVITKEATSRLGIGYLDMLNYQTRSKPQGFANGGAVGNSLPIANFGNGNRILVQINNNGEPVNATVSAKEDGDQLQITVELMKQMDKIADQRYRKNQVNDMRSGNVLNR